MYIGDTKMPVAALNVFNTVIIMLVIPVVDRVVYPTLAKYGHNPSQLQRIGRKTQWGELSRSYHKKKLQKQNNNYQIQE